MATSIKMQPVRRKVDGMSEFPHTPKINDVHPILVRNFAEKFIVKGSFRAGGFEGVEISYVHTGEREYFNPLSAKGCEGLSLALQKLIKFSAGAQNIIASAIKADQVRFEINRSLNLLVYDLIQEPSTNRKIGIERLRICQHELFRHTVRPTTHPVRAVGVDIAYPFGKRIADSYIADGELII
ncbi:Uncharacterised protein [Mycobacteroides abscessus subsp. abscessus]|nr:Uncharacterised protein [Mycobacteroides abscessus subsp. abscessus]